jgi:hypothetical protein
MIIYKNVLLVEENSMRMLLRSMLRYARMSLWKRGKNSTLSRRELQMSKCKSRSKLLRSLRNRKLHRKTLQLKVRKTNQSKVHNCQYPNGSSNLFSSARPYVLPSQIQEVETLTTGASMEGASLNQLNNKLMKIQVLNNVLTASVNFVKRQLRDISQRVQKKPKKMLWRVAERKLMPLNKSPQINSLHHRRLKPSIMQVTVEMGMDSLRKVVIIDL